MFLKSKTRSAAKNPIIRPELNLMRLAHFLFPHPETQGLEKRREISYVKKYGKNGDTELRSRVVILPSFENQCYTTKTLDVLSALFSVWEDLGKPNPYTSFTFSLRDVAKKMGLSFNGEVAKQIMTELNRMSVTTTKWQHAFRTNHSKKIHETVENMHLLWQLRYKSEARTFKANDVKFFENIKLIEVMFHQKIAENLDSNITIPMNLITYREIKSPIAIETFGPPAFEMQDDRKVNSAFEMRNQKNKKGAGRKTEIAILNEEQTALLLSFMKNTKKVKAFKIALIKEFYMMRRFLEENTTREHIANNDTFRHPYPESSLKEDLLAERLREKVAKFKRLLGIAERFVDATLTDNVYKTSAHIRLDNFEAARQLVYIALDEIRDVIRAEFPTHLRIQDDD